MYIYIYIPQQHVHITTFSNVSICLNMIGQPYRGRLACRASGAFWAVCVCPRVRKGVCARKDVFRVGEHIRVLDHIRVLGIYLNQIYIHLYLSIYIYIYVRIIYINIK